jgi:hypothetical protein
MTLLSADLPGWSTSTSSGGKNKILALRSGAAILRRHGPILDPFIRRRPPCSCLPPGPASISSQPSAPLPHTGVSPGSLVSSVVDLACFPSSRINPWVWADPVNSHRPCCGPCWNPAVSPWLRCHVAVLQTSPELCPPVLHPTSLCPCFADLAETLSACAPPKKRNDNTKSSTPPKDLVKT